MTLRVHRLDHVALDVRDLAASVRFYGEVLGLPRIERPAFGFPGAWFALGKQELHLVAAGVVRGIDHSNTHLGLLVDDALAVRRALEQQGVAGLQGPIHRPDGALQLFLRDPDGHVIEVLSWPASPGTHPCTPAPAAAAG